MDPAVSSAFVPDGGRVHLTHTAATRPTGQEGKWEGYARDGEEEPTRYCLNIRGYESTTYPVLSGVDTQFGQLVQRSLVCEEPDFLRFLEETNDGMEKGYNSLKI